MGMEGCYKRRESALEKDKIWEIVERPKGKNIVDCKWIFTLKYKVDESLERHKTRLVAQGYTQTYGYDVKNAFLHGDLDEEIYMNIPSGFEGNIGNKVCKLKKALYGPKESPRAWFGRFAKVMKESRYKQNQGDHTLFIKHSAVGGVIAFLVYIDDIIVTRNDEREKQEVKQRLTTEFEIKELGKLKYFIGIEVAYSIQGIFISNKSNHEKGILFKKNNALALQAYIDADYASSLVDRRSTIGYCTFFGGSEHPFTDLTQTSNKHEFQRSGSSQTDVYSSLPQISWLVQVNGNIWKQKDDDESGPTEGYYKLEAKSEVLLLEVQLLRVQASIFMGHLFSLYYESGHRHGDLLLCFHFFVALHRHVYKDSDDSHQHGAPLLSSGGLRL
ncbi:Copia protein [Vitis vinifera]|uniref:Copia protein n=1 Tax=Vitis vinifera TaxID=29760 RepID=A0A438HQ22_VITVI|nr:Copia protein [Vitis vinifera]